MRRSLTARMVLLGGALAVVVGIALGTLLLTITDMRQAARMARHSAQVLASANQCEKSLLDLETGARGFALTREERFLRPWRSARAALPRELETLTTLVADDPAQHALADQIGGGVRSYLDGYSLPLVDAVRRQDNPPPAVEGKRRVDDLRAQFARFDRREEALSNARRAASDRAARRAVGVGIVVLVLGVVLLLAFAAYLGRAVARPVRRAALAADRLAAGDLSTRVPVHGRDELALLANSFNAMVDSLRENLEELDSQQTELVLQTAELEDQQGRLASANAELRAQRDELSHITDTLADETERQQRFTEFADRLAEDPTLGARAHATLDVLADAAGAQIGALYAGEPDDGQVLLDTLGLDPHAVPGRIESGVGLVGRAVAEARVIEVDHEEATLTVNAFGREMPVRREIHVPLRYGERAIGVVTLGRVDSGEPLSGPARDVIEHLAEQGAVGLSNALVTRRAQRLAEINRAVLDTVRDGIFMTGPDGVMLANAPARELVEEVLGVPLEEAAELDPTVIAARVKNPEGFLAATEEIAADPDEPTFDEIELLDDGRVILRYTAPVHDVSGERLGRTTVLREVTAERESDRLKDELMATVSHELRTPLASIVGFTELLLMRDPEAEMRRQALETVHREANRLSDLIDDFLDLQRIAERGRLPLARQPTDLAPLVAEQVRLFAAQSTVHTLDVRMPDDPLVADADPARLKQVLANLLSNAIKYSPDGGRIAVEGWRRGSVVGVTVSDPGMGIPSTQQGRVFERFFRTSDATERAIGGTGLGLALSREIVEAHDGAIGFDSAEGQGSRFWFELPAAAPAAAPAEAGA